MTKLVVHAAKIPDNAMDLGTDGRRSRGVKMQNACNGQPWSPVPVGTPPSEVQICHLCRGLVEYTRSQREA